MKAFSHRDVGSRTELEEQVDRMAAKLTSWIGQFDAPGMHFMGLDRFPLVDSGVPRGSGERRTD